VDVVGRVEQKQAKVLTIATDWEDAPASAKRRIIMSVEGMEKCGKTHFALTAPGPVRYHNFDNGDEHVSQKFTAQGKVIRRATYMVSGPDATTQEMVDAADPVWSKFRRNYMVGLREGRTTIVDTGAEPWEILRMARFGKLTEVPPHFYGPVNAEWAALYDAAYSSDSNLIMLHRQKEEWVNKASAASGKMKGEKTGNWVLDGNKGTHFDTQINLRCFKDGREFCCEILSSRQNPDLDGMVVSGDMCNFQTIAGLVFPDSNEGEWE
jgi:hypothetical protein